MDYGLLGLQAHAAAFSAWPLMTRTYEQIGAIAEAAVADGESGFAELHGAINAHLTTLRTSTYLAKESWRAEREQVYAELYEACGRALGHIRVRSPLAPRIVTAAPSVTLRERVDVVLAMALGSSARGARHRAALSECLLDYAVRTQAILAEATRTQILINRLLGRPQPVQAFDARDLDVHNLLQGPELRRLPFLIDEVARLLGVGFTITNQAVTLPDDLVPAT
jgi:hypothetical protein